MTSYQTCERSGFVYDKHRMNYARDGSRPMDLGSAAHSLLENYHSVGKPLREHNSLQNSYKLIVNDAKQNYEIVSASILMIQQYERYLHRLIKEGHWYCDLIVLATEYKFSYKGVSGIFDLIVFDPRDGKIYVVDYKTTKSQLNSFYTSIAGSEQFAIYQTMLQRLDLGTDFEGVEVGGVIVVALKTKPVLATVFKTKGGKLSVSKSNKTSYEVFTQYLIDNGLPFYHYSDYIDWLGDEGASNKVFEHTYTQFECDVIFKKFQRRRTHILGIKSLEDCEYNTTYTCAPKCGIYQQCLAMRAGRQPDFGRLAPTTGKVVLIFGDKTK